jgi:alkylation response protein AidB-like acyl-CoA dehydrogenase
MAGQHIVDATAEQSRELAEGSREDWNGRSFLRELFLGRLKVDWIDPFPETPMSDAFHALYAELQHYLVHEVDSVQIDADEEYPEDVLNRLRKMGLFGIKISKKYGGLGFTQSEYCKLAELIGAHDSNLVALISAHNSIGVPQPVKLFGSDELKQKYLPRIAKGAITAFALTESDVGSDPARLATTITEQEDGSFILNGQKLWITNGTIAEMMVVMARDPETHKISALVVEMDWPGVEVSYRCRFMGLKALANGIIEFKNVKVPAENLVGQKGKGLKIALVTLNTGRLSLPAACVGGGRYCLSILKDWTGSRVQWGLPVGKHEAIAHKLADIAANTYAMESWCYLANELSMRDGYDIRLEAATAKEWGSTRGWDMLDEAMQIRGGRGYETEASLIGRGETPDAFDRMMRDSRINRIFEGSSEIMHLFMARELVDQHLKVSGVMLDPKASLGEKAKALPGITAFYAAWYPFLWMGFISWFRYRKFGKFTKELRYADRAARRLARNVFHLMLRWQAGLEKRQMVLFRTVDIAMELAVMVAVIVRTHKLQREGAPNAAQATMLTEQFCRNTRRFVEARFQDLWAHDDVAKYKVGQQLLTGELDWLFEETKTPAGDQGNQHAAK